MSARQVAARGGSVLTGMLAAALVAEGGYRLRDHGAFPHVNFYLPDAQLGVRLRPGATERISFGGNPVTQLRINADGYRGAELPPPRPDEILVVGDSQAFGLGVEEDQTFSARLAGLTGRPVVNAGVPTYGPEEYDAVVAEMLARRKPSLVVYTVNMANDLFETGHPNRERHAVWDGWAVRKDGEVKPPAAFPGRSWLFGRSHLVFALRKIARGNRPQAPDRGLASEGTWIDLLGAARQAESGRRKARDDLRAEVDAGERARGAAESQVERVERSLGAVPSMRKLKIPVDDQLEVLRYLPHLLHASRASVGDIVDVDEGEGTRPVPVTAELLEHAGVYRRQLEEALRDRGNAEARRLFDEWRARTDTLHALEMAPAQLLRRSSPLLPHVARMKELAAQHGARLVVLVLPLDVMVSAAEWAKYRAAPVDLAPARLLVEDLTRASEESGVAALDATAVLAAAEPGAFLDHDLHLTPRGHLAVARALAAKIAEAPPELPTGALPADRSPPPTPEAWLDGLESDGEFLAHEDDPRGPRCIVRHAGQWWRVDCSDPAPGSRKAQGVTLLAGGRGDALGFTTPSTMRLTAPVLSGDTLVADFAWTDVVQHLEIGPEARFSRRPVAAGGPSGPTAREAKLLSCLEQDKIGQWRFDGAADADCLRTYGDDCTRLLACAAGRPASPPDCPAGSVNAGVFHRCHQLCGAGRACPPGQRCDSWPGAHLCEMRAGPDDARRPGARDRLLPMSGRLLAGRAAQVLAGLLAAAALAEGAFWLRDRGAFPHVNFYVADAKLGVRLRPGATERISFGGNPVTHVRINADGYRGAELGPPRPEEILVVGDSQAFGLGVEEGETFAARLGALTGRPVVNAGVPTYGPDEYDAVVEEMLARRRPSIVVYTVNVANDLFEAERPNRERHVVWDGWAVRKESAPPASSSFPGRGWLFGRSHLMFAWRKKLHERQQAEGVDRGFASEGTWTDLVGAGRGAAGAREKARDEHRDKTKRDAAARTEAEREAAVEEERLAEAADLQKLGITLDEKLQDIGYTQEWLRTARASAGDIVQIDEGEESRSIPVTADLINRAGLFRRQLETALRTHRADVAAGGPADEAWELFQSWEKAADKLGTLRRSATQLLRHSSPLLPHVARLGQLCATHGARLVVLVLPLDVMVSPAEWAKYGAAPRDMAPARRLVEDLARASEEHGLNALDATDALAAAEPGAFLNRDLHLSPKGHEAVARALAIAINQSPPEMPTGALADGRSLPPGPDGWERSARTPGAKQAGCSVFRYLEWIRVLCYDFAHRGGTPGGVSLLRGGQGDAMTFTSPHAMLLVAPWPPDDDLAADFFWSNGVERFEIVPHLGMRFTSRPASGEGPKGPSALEKKLMACAGGAELKLRDLQLGADPDCARTYGDDCARLLECAQGDPASPPDCPPGSVNAGGLGRCHRLCGPGRACPQGQRCDAWPGTHVCE